MSFCTKCGNAVNSDARFCTVCGNTTNSDVPVTPVAVADPTSVSQPVANTEYSAPDLTVTNSTNENPFNTNSGSVPTEIPPYAPVEVQGKAPIQSPTSNFATDSSPRRENRAVATLLSVIISMFLFISIMPAGILTLVHSSLSTRSLTKTLDAISLDEFAENSGLTETILDSMDAETINRYRIDEDKIVSVLEETTINEFLAEQVNGYIVAIGKGDLKHTIAPADIVDLLRKNEDILEDELGISLSSSDYDSIEEYLDDSDILNDFAVGSILDDNVLIVSRYTFSIIPLIIILIVIAVLIILLCLVNRRRIRRAIMSIGVVSVLASLPFFTATTQLYSALTKAGFELNLVREVFPVVRMNCLIISVALLLVGAAGIAAYCIVRRVSRTEKIAA